MDITRNIPKPARPFVAGFWLIIAIPVTLMIAMSLEKILKFKFDTNNSPSIILLAVVHFGAGYLWARSLGLRSGLSTNKIFNIFGGLGFALGVVGLLVGLSEFAPILVDPWLGKFKGVGNLEFGALFAPWTGLVCGISGFALGIGLKNWKLSLKLLTLGFVTGVLIYLAIMFTMQLLGFKAYSGRPVMLPTTFLSMWVTALVGSAIFGKILSGENLWIHTQRETQDG